MRRTAILVCLGAVLLGAGVTNPEPKTNADYLSVLKCGENAGDEIVHGMCGMYLAGLMDGFQIAKSTQRLTGDLDGVFCPQEGISADLALSIYRDWIRNHPDGNTKPQVGVALKALFNHYPCDAKSKANGDVR